MIHVLANQDFLWTLVRSTKKQYKVILGGINDDQIKSVIECIINCNLEHNLLLILKDNLNSGKFTKVFELLIKNQETVKTSIALVLTELVNEINDG